MRTFLRSRARLLFVAFAVVLAVPAIALAAELVTSELDTVTPNAVTVQQGGSASFNIGLTATGAIDNTILSGNASTATVDTAYSLDSTGAVSGGTPSSAFNFYSSGTGCNNGGNCDVTWDGAPTPYSVGASVSAASNTPVGDYSLVLSDSANTTDLTNPSAQGGKLGDTTATTITVHVVAPTATNHAPTVSTAAADATGNEGSQLTTSGAFADQDTNDTLTITKLSGAGTVTPSTTTRGAWSWSHTPADNGSGTVVVQVDDGHGGTVTDSFDWTAANVAPSIGTLTPTGANATACLAGGNTVGLSFGFSDPAGANDTYTGSIAWGDGNTTPFGSSFSVSENHTYTTAGSYTIRVNVSDEDGGNATERTQAVSLLYNMSGILSPFNADGSSTFKYGSTVPVKVKITDCAGTPVSGLSPKLGVRLQSPTTPVLGINEDVYSTSNADTGNTLRYDASAGQYIYNYNTKSNMTPDSTASYYMVVEEASSAPNPVSQKFALKLK